MALMNRDGEVHSHLRGRDTGQLRDLLSTPGAAPGGGVQLPDRGTWVGPRPGETRGSYPHSATLEEVEAAKARRDAERAAGSATRVLRRAGESAAAPRASISERLDAIEQRLTKLEMEVGQ
jgi:hypothetical protein